MTLHDLINSKKTEIISTIRESYRTVVDCEGRIQYTIYIWSDGEIERLQETNGGHNWLVANDDEMKEEVLDWYYSETVGDEIDQMIDAAYECEDIDL